MQLDPANIFSPPALSRFDLLYTVGYILYKYKPVSDCQLTQAGRSSIDTSAAAAAAAVVPFWIRKENGNQKFTAERTRGSALRFGIRLERERERVLLSWIYSRRWHSLCDVQDVLFWYSWWQRTCSCSCRIGWRSEWNAVLGGPVCSATAAVVVQSIFSISNLRRARSFAHSRATVQSSFSAARSISAGPASCLSLIAFPKWTVRLPSAEKYHGASIFLQKEFQYAIGLGILGTCADCGSARGKGERAECAVLAYWSVAAGQRPSLSLCWLWRGENAIN